LKLSRRLNGSAAYWIRLAGAFFAESDIAPTLYYCDTNPRAPARLRKIDSLLMIALYGKCWNLYLKYCSEA
jgi:hypothetical protein